MAKKLTAILIIVLIIVSVISIQASAKAASDFKDVPSGKWYYTAIDYAVKEGLFGGTSTTTFSPEEPMTRGMFVRVLGNKAGIKDADYPGSSFSDVAAGKWYTSSVQWAAKNEIEIGRASCRERVCQYV